MSPGAGEKWAHSTPPGCKAVLLTRSAAMVMLDVDAVNEQEWKVLRCCFGGW